MTNAGIEINGKHSYKDFGLYLKYREVGIPERKSVTATVPYMSGYYDFSALFGEPAYNSRPLQYTFDLMADTPEEVEELKNEVCKWAMTALESKIYDDDDPDYYFRGSYQSATYTEDDELPEMGGELVLNFTAQPYRYDRRNDEGVI